MITDIEVVDEYTIRFTTEYPFAPLPGHFAHQVSGMVSPELIEADYAAMEEGRDPGAVINEGPIGNGHFKYDESEPGNYVRLVRNDNHWDENALLDSVTFKVVEEDGTRIAEISTGEVHVSNPVSPSDVNQIEQTDGLHVAEQASVRLDYDVEKAKELLAEAGYEDGFSTTIWTNDKREQVDTAVNIQSQLEEIGIDVKIQELESGAFLEQTGNGKHDMFVIGWTNATGDIDNSTYSLFHSKNVGHPGNRTFTENDELDELLDQGRQTPDASERFEIYSEMQELFVDLAPMIYTHYPVHLLSARDEVKGLEQIPTGFLILDEVYIEE